MRNENSEEENPISSLPPNATLAQAIEYLRQHIKKGANCPCCQGYIKTYSRSINSANAMCLIELYNISEKHGYKFYHLNELKELSKKFMKMVNGGEFARMRHYGFIVDQPKADGDKKKKTTGYWMLTSKGKEFVKGHSKVYKNMLLLNNQVLGYEGDLVTIEDCLTEKFSYQKIMADIEVKGKLSSSPEKVEHTLFSQTE